MEMSLVPFQPCSSFIISGGTGSGKTYWTYRFLQNSKDMIQGKPVRKVMYCYGVFQPLFDDMVKTIPNFELHQGLPNSEVIQEFTRDGEHNLIILDDLMHQVTHSPDMVLLFTQGCHHRNLSVIFIVQNIFQSGKYARDIALNTNYIIIFRNLRDASQISHLARQLYPGKSSTFINAYKDCTRLSYSYIIVDLSPHSDDKLRLRTHVFPDEYPIIYQL